MTDVRVTLFVNRRRQDLDLEADRTLATVLREDSGLTGPHLGCPDGTCGACTVLVDDQAVRSCMTLAVQCDRADVRTIEGLDPERRRRAVRLASKSTDHCAPCVPGLAMLLAAAPDDRPDVTSRLSASNICRHRTGVAVE
jgi:aerobic-type carbon monoxide dehydrogenase small subunit (CoxS/CutS family)